jgi:hypothetical protein
MFWIPKVYINTSFCMLHKPNHFIPMKVTVLALAPTKTLTRPLGRSDPAFFRYDDFCVCHDHLRANIAASCSRAK